jgi:hypothetical protein
MRRWGLIGGGLLAALLLAAGLWWMRSGGAEDEIVVLEVVTGPGGRKFEIVQLPNGEKAKRPYRPGGRGRKIGTPRIRRDGKVTTNPDTGPDPNGPDTGITREQIIDEMIEDVAKDTGLDEEGRRRMTEALLRNRDGVDAPEEPEPGTPPSP